MTVFIINLSVKYFLSQINKILKNTRCNFPGTKGRLLKFLINGTTPEVRHYVKQRKAVNLPIWECLAFCLSNSFWFTFCRGTNRLNETTATKWYSCRKSFDFLPPFSSLMKRETLVITDSNLPASVCGGAVNKRQMFYCKGEWERSERAANRQPV